MVEAAGIEPAPMQPQPRAAPGRTGGDHATGTTGGTKDHGSDLLRDLQAAARAAIRAGVELTPEVRADLEQLLEGRR